MRMRLGKFFKGFFICYNLGMPGGGGDSFLSAVSTRMKWCRPGKSAKLSKTEKHFQRISSDPVKWLERRAYYFKLKCLNAYYLLMGKTKLKARLINEYLFDPITSIRIDGCNSRSVFLLFNHGPPIDIRSDKEDEIPDSNNKRQGKIYLSPIIRRDTIKYPENYGNKKSKIGKFLRNAATGAMAAYLLFAGPGCNLTSPYDADKPKPPEQYVLVINATGLYNNQPISNFHVRAEGPETEEVDGINGVARFEGDKALLKGPYRIILSNGPFYGGNAGDPAHPTRYVNLAGPTEFPVDLVENGSIDFTFLEDIMFNPTNRWTTTPRFDIYKKTLYEGKTYEFSDSDINNLRQWIQTYVPQMARGKQFQMGVPQVTVKEETFTNPAAPFVNNVIITYPFYYTSQARAPPDNNVLL